MKQEFKSQFSYAGVMDRIKNEYKELVRNFPLSLKKNLLPPDFHFDEFCKDFSPHPQAEKIKDTAMQFGQSYGIWLDNSRHSVSCASYLYPTAEYDKVLTITNLLTVGFYLNDLMGRDVFKTLSNDQQRAARELVKNMAAIDLNIPIASDRHPLELANAVVLSDIKKNTPEEWFENFLKLHCYHQDITHKDCNSNAIGHIPTVNEFIEIRCHYAAVHYLILLVEYSTAQFLDWKLLSQADCSEKLRRLHWIAAAFPALVNDMFSFENEVIDNDCDSNLIVVLMLNNPAISLREAIEQSAQMVRNLIAEISTLIIYFEKEVCIASHISPEMRKMLSVHIRGIKHFFQASWLWQAGSKRYKREASIWIETSLPLAAVPV